MEKKELPPAWDKFLLPLFLYPGVLLLACNLGWILMPGFDLLRPGKCFWILLGVYHAAPSDSRGDWFCCIGLINKSDLGFGGESITLFPIKADCYWPLFRAETCLARTMWGETLPHNITSTDGVFHSENFSGISARCSMQFCHGTNSFGGTII